jgi:SecD/SecF fusion protein
MRNKNTVIALLAVFVLICAYNLYFTYQQFSLDGERAEKERIYDAAVEKVDSLRRVFTGSASDSVTVEDRLYFLTDTTHEIDQELRDYLKNDIEDFTRLRADTNFQKAYKKAIQNSFTLGLDLQGGMFVTLEVGIGDVLRQMASNSQDPDFLAALECATKASAEEAQSYVPLFVNCFQEIAPEKKLGAIFADPSARNGEGISVGTDNDDVIAYLEEEANSAIDRTFDVIRTRIDQFGVVSPNLQKQPSTGRILLELPGVKEPERVRELLRSTAKLEFWTTQPWTYSLQVLNEINTQLARDFGVLDTTANDTAQTTTAADAGEEEATEGDSPEAMAGDSNQTDTSVTSVTDLGDTTATGSDLSPEELAKIRRENPLFARLNIFPTNRDPNNPYIGQALASDTALINSYFRMESIKPLIPSDIRFVWDFKPVSKTNSNVYNLLAIRDNEEGEPAMDGDAVSQARQDIDQSGGRNAGQAVVSLNMTQLGTEEWGRITTANVGKFVAILLDGYAYSVPIVNEPITTGNTQISGNFTIDEAKDLANVLKAGKLPAPARIAGEETVGPTLGEENIDRGLNSFLIAFLITLVFMVFYYRQAGLVADVALLANLIFILGCSAAFTIVLTLPGIAAIVLTVGMAVDANVLIFERIREEQKKGKTVKASIKSGFQNAFSSVMDANITTFLTGVVLYAFGVGPIRGFAVSLMIGILTSLISALIITRLILDYNANLGGSLDEKQLKTERNFNVLIAVLFAIFITVVFVDLGLEPVLKVVLGTLTLLGALALALVQIFKLPITFGNKYTLHLFDRIRIMMTDRRKTFYTVSASLVLASLLSIGFLGFKYGVDFEGGRMYKISFFEADSVQQYPLNPAEINDIRTELTGAFENNEPVVKTVSNDNQLMITTNYRIGDREATQEVEELMENTVESAVPAIIGVDEVQDVGPTVANDIRTAAYLSVLFSLLIIFFYILVRFRKWQYSLGAIAAVFHDVVIVLGIFSVLKLFDNLPFNVEINQAMIAALLTIVGYSINDTVVVFDRIRENIGEMKSSKISNIYNVSIDQTISRTLITSFTTFLTALILFSFGGDSIKGFIFGIMIGIIVGTYSSIFVASPIALDLIRRQQPELDK